MYIETFKFKGVNLDIYKTDKGFTVNYINFYDNIKDLKDSCKELIRKMRGERSYGIWIKSLEVLR